MSGTAPAWATARLLMVCAALVGLFFMHGLPAQSCPGAAGAPDTTMTPMPAAASTMAPGPTRHRMAHGVSDGGDTVSGHGGVCVSTTPPRGLDLLVQSALMAAIALVLTTSLPWPGPRSRAGRAALPRAGPDIRARLCVSRT